MKKPAVKLNRPFPPPDLAGFAPAPALVAWIQKAYIAPDGFLYNPMHEHLASARIGVLWTNVLWERQGRRVMGSAEMPRAGAGWAKARGEWLLGRWFDAAPDFLLTFDAPMALEVDDATWCALVEHELCHCGQATYPGGIPKFRKDGTPVFTLRGHDVEQFNVVVERYGAEAAGVTEMVRAARLRPLMASETLAQVCGVTI